MCLLGYLHFPNLPFPFKCGGHTLEIGIFSFSEGDFPSGNLDGQSWWSWEMENKEERLPVHFFLLMTKDYNRVCCCVQLWWVGFCIFFFEVCRFNLWWNYNCWPCTILSLLGTQIFNLAPGVQSFYHHRILFELEKNVSQGGVLILN